MAASPSPSRQPSPFGAVAPTPAAPASSTSAVAVPPHESRSKLVVGARVVSPRRSFPSLPAPATSSTNSLSVASAEQQQQKLSTVTLGGKVNKSKENGSIQLASPTTSKPTRVKTGPTATVKIPEVV